MISSSVTMQQKKQKCLEFFSIFIFYYKTTQNVGSAWKQKHTLSPFNHVTLLHMLEIHISRSTWFVVATTNNKRLKNMNFDNSTSKIRLGVLWAQF